MSEIQLPIVLEPQHAESAMGYVLRCAHDNGTNLHGLRRSIGMPDVGLISYSHARSLAWLLQCSEEWLATGLGSIHKEDGVSTLYCWGHKFYSTNHVRRQWPQLCPECVHHDGYCQRVWDLSMATVCARHQRWLVDECMYCHARLRWDRPSVDVCHCGYGFEPDARSLHMDEPLQAFALLLEELVSDDVRASISDFSALPQFLCNMPVSGVVILMEALGRLEFQHQVVHMTLRTKSLRTYEWGGMVTRALTRLSELDEGKLESHMLVDQVALGRLFNRSTNVLELQVASLIASHMPSGERPDQHHLAMQLPLFS